MSVSFNVFAVFQQLQSNVSWTNPPQCNLPNASNLFLLVHNSIHYISLLSPKFSRLSCSTWLPGHPWARLRCPLPELCPLPVDCPSSALCCFLQTLSSLTLSACQEGPWENASIDYSAGQRKYVTEEVRSWLRQMLFASYLTHGGILFKPSKSNHFILHLQLNIFWSQPISKWPQCFWELTAMNSLQSITLSGHDNNVWQICTPRSCTC